MKSKDQLQGIIDRIAAADSPVGMDAVYVHALILDRLTSLHEQLERLEEKVAVLQHAADKPDGD